MTQNNFFLTMPIKKATVLHT